MEYHANGGLTCLPVDGMKCGYDMNWTPVPRPDPLLPVPQVRPEWAEKGFFLVTVSQHFLPGVKAEMIDWFWANMEKCYYLWAPGAHKSFQWVREPWKYGFLGSRIAIGENCGPDVPCCIAQDGEEDHYMQRLDMDLFPLDYALDHVLMESMGADPAAGKMFDNNIHMWQDVEGGCNHITVFLLNEKALPPGVTKEDAIQGELRRVQPEGMDFTHQDYECSHWPVFLPKLYEIWKDHPDPCQNVRADLTVEKVSEGKWRYVHENGPVFPG